MALKDSLIADLKKELQIVDVDFNADILEIKVDMAIRKVKEARNYPLTFTNTMIENDLAKFYGNIRDIALYFYNKVGADYEESYTSNGVTRHYVDEAKLYRGIRPIARL